MMDSQENALNQGAEEVKQQEVAVEKEVKDDSKAAETPTPETAIEKSTENAEGQKAEETQSPTLKVYNSKKDIVERIKEIAESDETPEKAEIDHLKTTFYKMHFAERKPSKRLSSTMGAIRRSIKCSRTKMRRTLRQACPS